MRERIKRGGIIFFAAVFLFFIVLSIFIGVFACKGRPIATVSFSARYYFLVRDCESTTAGAVAGESYLAGGAGYWLEEENAVVLSAYYLESDAEFVAGTMSEREVAVRVLMREAAPFAVNGDAAKFASRIEANASVMDASSRMLFGAANDLERGVCSQEEARAAVMGAARALGGLAAENDGAVFSLLTPELERIERRAKELAAGILFAKDLRYLQVRLLLAVVSLDEYFV